MPAPPKKDPFNAGPQPNPDIVPNTYSPHRASHRFLVLFLLGFSALFIIGTITYAAYYYSKPPAITNIIDCLSSEDISLENLPSKCIDYISYTKNVSKNETPQTTSPINPSINWNTHHSLYNKYQIQLPPRFILTNINAGISYVPDFNLDYKTVNQQFFQGGISTYLNTNNYSLEKFVDQEICDGKDINSETADWPRTVYQSCVQTFEGSKKVSNIKKYQGLVGAYNPYEHSIYVQLFKQDQHIYHSHLSGYETGNIPSDTAFTTMSEIFATISLDDPQQPPTGWATYLSPQMLSFAYPEKYSLDESFEFINSSDNSTVNISAKSVDSDFDLEQYINNRNPGKPTGRDPETRVLILEPTNTHQTKLGIFTFTTQKKDDTHTAYLVHKQTLYTFRENSPLKEFDFHQILSTFEFIDQTNPTSDTGISGKVWLGSICTSDNQLQDCSIKPYQASISVIDSHNNTIASQTSDSQGNYQFFLPPGAYTITPNLVDSNIKIPPYPPQPISVTVQPNSFTLQDITYDSGVR